VIVQNAVMARASGAPDRTVVLRLAAELEWVGPWLIGPSSLVVIGLGIWLVLLVEWAGFSQLWIWLSLALVAVSMAQASTPGLRASGCRAWPTSAGPRTVRFGIG
jgi:hypothetical protein